MSYMKSPNNSVPGLAMTLCIIVGGMAGLWFAGTPGAWPHSIIASLMTFTGHPSTHLMQTAIGAAVAALLALVPGLWLETKMKDAQRRAAARRDALAATEVDHERAKLAAAKTA